MDVTQVRHMKFILLFSSLASFGLFAAAVYQENFSGEWRKIQQAYRQRLLETADDDRARLAASTFRIRPQQAYLPELGAIDRCTTCHLGVENPKMAHVEQPFRLHPGDILAQHPTDHFGCTICHEGQGRLLTKEAAHGWQADGTRSAFAQSPLLRGEAVYTSCGRCHYEVDLYAGQADLYAYSFGHGSVDVQKPQIDEAALGIALAGAERLAQGKRLVSERGCLGCHKYRGGGGELGTDLTYIGDKPDYKFDFTHIRGEHTVEQWHYEHFLRPDEISPGTVMPPMGFTPEQARSLALYMMSLHRKNAPATHTPRPQTVILASMGSASGEVLYKMFCCACHGETGRGDGPAVGTIEGHPRDFWHERFRYVSTGNGIPTQEDLIRTISTGRRFGVMPSDPQLTEAEVLRLAEYVRKLNRAGWIERLMAALEEEDEEITSEEAELIAQRRLTPARIVIVPWPGADFRPNRERGHKLYVESCAPCHGRTGRGDGSQELVDELGRRIQARNLTSGEFRGGAETEELFKRIRCGMPGTPMPAQEQLSDEDIWQLVHYVRDLAHIDD